MAQRMMACLAIAALAGAVSCTDAPTTAPDTVALAVVPGTDSVTLTYICGNMFRVRNSSFEPRRVRWDIYNAAPADTGSLRARGRDVGAAYVDYYVTSRTKGTMRLFVGTTLVNTKANGNKAACAAPVDTSRFPAVDAVVRLDEAIMTLSDSSIISRTQITVKFQAGSSLAAQREFQRTFAAQYLGGAGAFRTFRIPDTIANEDSLESVTARLKQSGVVRFAAFLLILGPAKNDGARFPNDASGYRRGDYIGKNGRVWAATAMRLPQAWWCETGLYSNELTRLAVLEQNFAGDSLPDFAPSLSVVRFSEWKADTSLKNKPSQRNETAFRNHGAAVASVLTAAGDNSIGMSGVLWKSATKLYSMENTDSSRAAGAYVFVKYVLDRLIADQPRVLSLSSDFGPYRTEDLLEQNADQSLLALRRLLMALPNLTIVKSAGNDTITASTYDAAPLKKRTAMLTALLRLRDSTAFADRIVIVGATDRTNQRATFSSDLPEVDIYAPGVDIPVLRPNGAIAIESGTSFSTPLVAGVVGALVAMDPSLPASEVKQLLMEGAKDSVENSNGVNQLP